MQRSAVVLMALAGCFIGAAARADDVMLESVPPVVVKTVPAAGADEVDER